LRIKAISRDARYRYAFGRHNTPAFSELATFVLDKA